jgi:hypothetical protein
MKTSEVFQTLGFYCRCFITLFLRNLSSFRSACRILKDIEFHKYRLLWHRPNEGKIILSFMNPQSIVFFGCNIFEVWPRKHHVGCTKR